VRLYAVLDRYADRRTRASWPSRERLADRLGVSLSTLDRAVAELKEHGWLTVTQRGLTQSNLYVLRIPVVSADSSESSSVTGRESSPVTNKREPLERERKSTRALAKNDDADDPGFDVFWQLWPRKVARPNALLAWRRAMRRADSSDVIAGAESWRAAWQTAGTSSRFIPHAATWLNRDGWHDPADVQPEQRSRLDVLSVLDRVTESDIIDASGSEAP
jgi:hypothetical protein